MTERRNKKPRQYTSEAMGRLQVDIPYSLLEWLEATASEKGIPKRRYVESILDRERRIEEEIARTT